MAVLAYLEYSETIYEQQVSMDCYKVHTDQNSKDMLGLLIFWQFLFVHLYISKVIQTRTTTNCYSYNIETYWAPQIVMIDAWTQHSAFMNMWPGLKIDWNTVFNGYFRSVTISQAIGWTVDLSNACFLCVICLSSRKQVLSEVQEGEDSRAEQ